MKAISTFVATVLLIALTVAVAGIIGTFITGTTKTQTETTREASDKLAKCGSVVLDIDEVKTNSSLNPVNVTFTYVYGRENLYNFTVFIIDSGNRINSTSSLSPSYTEANPLTPGKTTFWNISTTNWGLSGSLYSVRIVGLCQKDFPVSTSCDAGYSCMKS